MTFPGMASKNCRDRFTIGSVRVVSVMAHPLGCVQGHHHESDLDQLEVLFACTAFWANPIGRHIFPASTGCNALLGKAGLFIVDPTTNQTHPGSHNPLARSKG